MNTPGRCTRCKRVLKRTFFVDGAPYGSVCVLKVGGTTATPRTPREKKVTGDPGQENIFTVDMGKIEQQIFANLQTDFGSGDRQGVPTYTGLIVGDEDERSVTVQRDGRSYPLNPRFDCVNHSPTGFCWGYGGSGPAQLSFAILADYLGDAEAARVLYQDFKSKVVAGLEMARDFVLTARQVEDAITKINIERMHREK
jgi:Family of unknown function (DUF6166)